MDKIAQGFQANWQETERRIADSLYEAQDRDISMMKFGDIEHMVNHRMTYFYAINELQDLQQDIDQAAVHGAVPEHVQDPDLREEIEAMKMARGEMLLETHLQDLTLTFPETAQKHDPKSVLSYTKNPDYPAVLQNFTENHSQGDQQILLEQVAAAEEQPQPPSQQDQSV